MDLKKDKVILNRIQQNINEFKKLLKEQEEKSLSQLYRYYHISFKVYGLQKQTLKIYEKIRYLMPEEKVNPMFQQIIDEGTGKKWELKHNKEWEKNTRPIIEAHHHMLSLLKAIVSSENYEVSSSITEEWGLILYFFNLRK